MEKIVDMSLPLPCPSLSLFADRNNVGCFASRKIVEMSLPCKSFLLKIVDVSLPCTAFSLKIVDMTLPCTSFSFIGDRSTKHHWLLCFVFRSRNAMALTLWAFVFLRLIVNELMFETVHLMNENVLRQMTTLILRRMYNPRREKTEI